MMTKHYLERWLDHARANVAPQTYRRYAQIVEKELTPAFGVTKLADLSPLQIQAFPAQGLSRPCKTKTTLLATRTVLHFHRVLKRAPGHAVRWQLLSRNPCDLVDPPRVQPTQMHPLDEDGLLALLGCVRSTPLYSEGSKNPESLT